MMRETARELLRRLITLNISSEIVPIIEKLIKNNSETPTIEVKANRLESDKLGHLQYLTHVY